MVLECSEQVFCDTKIKNGRVIFTNGELIQQKIIYHLDWIYVYISYSI